MYFRMPNLSRWPCHWLAQMLEFNLLTSEIHWDEQSFGESLFSHLFKVTCLKSWVIIDIGTEPSHRREFWLLRVFVLQIILIFWIPSASLMSYDALHSCMVLGVHILFLGSNFRGKANSFMSYTSIAKVWGLDIEDNYSCFTWWLSCDSSPACCSLYLLFLRCELCPSVAEPNFCHLRLMTHG